MVFDDFFNKYDINEIVTNVKAHSEFGCALKVKENGLTVIIEIRGAKLKDIELAKSTWHGNTYLVHYGFTIHGKNIYSGNSFATDEYDCFKDAESFRAFIDKYASRNPIYKIADVQLSLF